MKRIIFIFAFIFAMCGFSFAQSPLAAFEKAREIKLLESTRNDVKRILGDYEPYEYESQDYDEENDEIDLSGKTAKIDEIDFVSETTKIKVKFSSGDCSHVYEYWKVAEDLARQIEITFNNAVKVEDFRFDFSSYIKKVPVEKDSIGYREVKDGELPEDYIYENESSGVIFIISDNKIKTIVLIPLRTSTAPLCKNKKIE